MNRRTETEIAAAVIEHLAEWGWEAYQEVEGPGGGRCDIVATRGRLIWAIECKVSFGLAVLGQAWNWRHRAHYVSVAVGSSPGTQGIAHDILRHYGIGLMAVPRGDWFDSLQIEWVRPRFNRRIGTSFTLHEEQKNYCPAGTQGGGHWTPFKRTVAELVRFVGNHPDGVLFADAVKKIDTHYRTISTAKACLKSYIGTPVIPELELKMVGRKLYVVPASRACND